MARSMLAILVIGLPLQLASQAPTGRWTVELWMDSAGALGPRPTARYVRGQVGFDTLHANSGSDTDGQRWTRRYWPGRFAIDLKPFFGAQIGDDVSTTVFGPFDSTSSTEVEAEYPIADSVQMNFIPRVSHGGLTATGRVRGDTIAGVWHMRAYCCGAVGRFRMLRVSESPLTFRRPPPPQRPPPLPVDKRAEIRVRTRDSGTGEFFAGKHSLIQFNPWTSKCCYTTGTQPGGWGVYFWLPPGRYQIELSEFSCNGRFASLRKPVVYEFTAVAGDTVEVTLEVARQNVPLAPTYDNREGVTCGALRAP